MIWFSVVPATIVKPGPAAAVRFSGNENTSVASGLFVDSCAGSDRMVCSRAGSHSPAWRCQAGWYNGAS